MIIVTYLLLVDCIGFCFDFEWFYDVLLKYKMQLKYKEIIDDKMEK